MKSIFEVRLIPRVAGPVIYLIVRVEGIENYVQCIAYLEEKYPEYEVISVLEGYKEDGRSSGETGQG